MVVVTNSSQGSASPSFESYSSEKFDKFRKYNAVAPPWCSLAKVPDRKKQKIVQDRSRSLSPMRENIYQYLNGDKRKLFKRKHNLKTCCKHTRKNKNSGKTLFFLIFLLLSVGIITFLWNAQTFSDTENMIFKIMPTANFISYLGLEQKSVIADTKNFIFKVIPIKNFLKSVDLDQTSATEKLILKFLPTKNLKSLLGLDQTTMAEECCSRIKYLTAELVRAEKSLKSTLRLRKTMLTATHNKIDFETDDSYIEGIQVKRGKDTKEWGSRVALWGIVPLWRANPPPDTVLSKRKPLPSDCWPYIGSSGELIMELPNRYLVRSLSIEHVNPDAALSAPKHFILFSILANGTWLKTVDAQYKHRGPAKQYFPLLYQDIPHQHFIFKVLTNQGNKQYTCIYRVHLYERIGSVYL